MLLEDGDRKLDVATELFGSDPPFPFDSLFPFGSSC